MSRCSCPKRVCASTGACCTRCCCGYCCIHHLSSPSPGAAPAWQRIPHGAAAAAELRPRKAQRMTLHSSAEPWECAFPWLQCSLMLMVSRSRIGRVPLGRCYTPQAVHLPASSRLLRRRHPAAAAATPSSRRQVCAVRRRHCCCRCDPGRCGTEILLCGTEILLCIECSFCYSSSRQFRYWPRRGPGRCSGAMPLCMRCSWALVSAEEMTAAAEERV